jgi:outer membrane protein assembly factor BamD
VENRSFTALKKRFDLYLILAAICVAGFASCDGYNKLLKSTNYELKFQKANEYYEKGNYIRAAQLFEELIPVVRGTDKAEEVYYKYVWSEYRIGDLLIAQFRFKDYTRQYPAGKHVEECYFMNAYCYFLTSPNYRLDQTYTRNAIKEFQSFIDSYPDSPRIDTCNVLIDELRLKLELKDAEIIRQYHDLSDWKATIVAARNFAREYPASRYNEEMLFLVIDSYYLLAINSVESKKEERLNGAIENYVKFVDLYPESTYLSRAESIYNQCKRLKANLNTHGF